MIDLQRFRKDKKYDQKYISSITGLDQAIISKYENKKMVTEHITNTLLSYFPELESYMIDDMNQDNIASEPIEPYQTREKKLEGDQQYLAIIAQLVASNEILARSVEKMAENITLISQIKVQKMKPELV